MEFPLSLLPGMAHAVTTIAVGYPFDVVKTRLQTAVDVSFADSVKRLARGGPAAFYRGCSVPLLSLACKRPVEFLVFEATSRESNSHFIGGFVAGAVGTVLGCPFSVIKVKTQTQNLKVREIFNQIRKESGVRGFFRGLTASMMITAPAASIYLGCYGATRELFPSVWWNPGASGALASMSLWLIIMPADVVKTRLQASCEKERVKQTILWMVHHIYKDKGIRGFWAGWIPTTIRSIPVSACSMTAYECVKSCLSS
eukprot:GEMP01098110.1.p1 GENE.GEMP01098110.1~~GEMP01098110.1.p1  ORF type:complete len:256 (+),score=21.81 GEMP01098110.1:28-795(+)